MKSSIATKPLLTLDEVATLLALSRAAVYRSAKRGDLPLPIVRINGRMRVPRLAVQRLLAGDIPALAPPPPTQSAAPTACCPRCGEVAESSAERIWPT